MARPGVRQVPEGSGEQGKMEDTVCEVICGAPTTPAVKESVKVKAKAKAYVCVCVHSCTRSRMSDVFNLNTITQAV